MSVDFNGSHSSPRPDSVRKAEPLRCWALTAGPWLRPPTPPILAPQRSSPRLRIRPAEGRSRRWSRRPPSSGGSHPRRTAPFLPRPRPARLHQSRRPEAHVERGTRSGLRSTRWGGPCPPDPPPPDLGRPGESFSRWPSPFSGCPRYPPTAPPPKPRPAAITPKSWHQTLQPMLSEPPRRFPGVGRDSSAAAAPPPGFLLTSPNPPPLPGTWATASAGHSPDDRVPSWGRRAARAPAAPGLGIPQPLLPEETLPAATSAAPAAAGATKRWEAARRAGVLRAREPAQDERQARAHGEARAVAAARTGGRAGPPATRRCGCRSRRGSGSRLCRGWLGGAVAGQRLEVPGLPSWANGGP